LYLPVPFLVVEPWSISGTGSAVAIVALSARQPGSGSDGPPGEAGRSL